MRFFNRKKHKNKKVMSKELLSYEDGEIVSVGIVEKETTSDETDSVNVENTDSVFNNLKERIFKPFSDPRKFIRYLLYTFIGIIILLILLDLFKLLFSSEQHDSPPVGEQTEYVLENGSSFNNGDHLSTDDDYANWKQLLKTTERTNDLLVSLSTEEVRLYKQYKDKRINRLALERKLGRSLEEKERAIRYFEFHENGYKNHKLDLLYNKTMERNHASLEFTTNLISMINSYNKSIQQEIERYIENDNLIANEQDLYVSTFLSNKNLEYYYDENTGYFSYE